MGDLLCYTVLN